MKKKNNMKAKCQLTFESLSRCILTMLLLEIQIRYGVVTSVNFAYYNNYAINDSQLLNITVT